jgi:hypothetical protein
MQRPAAVPPRLLGDGPDGVDDAGEVAEEGEDEADPELNPAAELEEDPERRQDDGEDDVDAGRRAVRHLLDLFYLGRVGRGGENIRAESLRASCTMR